MKRTYNIIYLIVVLAAILGFTGCSSDTETPGTPEAAKETVQVATPEEPELLTVKDTIEYNLNDVMGRLHLYDRSGLYDNEFEYFRAETSLDEYLKSRKIKNARVDSLSSLEAVNVTLFEHDSAEVELIVHFDGPTGKHTEFPDWVKVYYHNGNWIKPTASTIDAQVEWEKSGSH